MYNVYPQYARGGVGDMLTMVDSRMEAEEFAKDYFMINSRGSTNALWVQNEDPTGPDYMMHKRGRSGVKVEAL